MRAETDRNLFNSVQTHLSHFIYIHEYLVSKYLIHYKKIKRRKFKSIKSKLQPRHISKRNDTPS